MFTCYVWFRDQWKHAIHYKQGTKYTQFILLDGTLGVRLVKMKDPTFKARNVTWPALEAAVKGYNHAATIAGITKAAEAALIEVDSYAKEMETSEGESTTVQDTDTQGQDQDNTSEGEAP